MSRLPPAGFSLRLEVDKRLQHLAQRRRISAIADAPKRGSYSIVILRRVTAGKVRTQVVAGEVYPKPDESVAANVYKISAVLDLNGDGKLEVIVHSFYYEGGQTTIYRCEPDKIEAALSVECGA